MPRFHATLQHLSEARSWYKEVTGCSAKPASTLHSVTGAPSGSRVRHCTCSNSLARPMRKQSQCCKLHKMSLRVTTFGRLRLGSQKPIIRASSHVAPRTMQHRSSTFCGLCLAHKAMDRHAERKARIPMKMQVYSISCFCACPST